MALKTLAHNRIATGDDWPDIDDQPLEPARRLICAVLLEAVSDARLSPSCIARQNAWDWIGSERAAELADWVGLPAWPPSEASLQNFSMRRLAGRRPTR